jgi:hypothetical protein
MAIVRPAQDPVACEEWICSRPPKVQEAIRKCPPDRLYRMKSGHRCTIYSYSEDAITGDVTLIVDVTGEFNRVLFGRRVFGVAVDELAECDLPTPNEDLGDTAAETGYTENDICNILIPKLKENFANRPDDF